MRAPVRVCMVNGTFFPVIGGAEQNMLRLATHMHAEGREVLVVTYRVERKWPSRETINGVPVIRTGGLFLRGKLRRRWGLATLPMLIALLRNRKRYDLIHVHEMLESAFVAIIAGRLLRKPVVMILENTAEYSEMNILRTHDGLIGRFMASRILKSRAFAAAISSDCERELLESGVPPSRVRRIPHCIDTSAFAKYAAGFPVNPAASQIVVCVARLVPQKAHAVLLDAWRQVIDQVPTARLKLLGDGPLRGELEAQATRLGIGGAVEFVGITHEVPTYLAQASIYVLPSWTEGLGIATIEAMYAGLACVATRVPGSRDLIHHGQTGLLVEPGNVDELARALLTFLTHPEFARECGRRARAVVEATYTAQAVSNAYDQLYGELMAAR